MDDLYGDLENYNEVNTLEELRHENKDLKLKLEEYETAMGKLQKDYDNLTMEFHNLQKNYSSLLKTARAEVERKAQMITQLNLDKDIMVLKSLQNGNNRRILNNKNKFQKDYNPNKLADMQYSKDTGVKKTKNEQHQRNVDLKIERCETSSVSTNASLPNGDNTKLLNIVDKVVENVQACISKGELKENLSYKPEGKEDPRVHASSIKNRRKSIPAVSMPKFSSDEDDPEKSINPEVPTKENAETRKINAILTRISNERISNKTSDNSSMDGRSSNYLASTRDGSRSRTSRQYENDKYSYRHSESDRYRDNDYYRVSDKYRDVDKHRGSDKYREGDKYRDIEKFRGKGKFDHRYRKQNSPDRPYKRNYRQYQDDHRPEYGRHQVQTSPPPESHSQYHHRSQDQLPFYEGYGHDMDRYNHCFDRRYAGKHLLPDNHDEPISKRQKVQAKMEIDENRKHHDRAAIASSSKNDAHEYDRLRASCQSPDAIFPSELHTDATSAHTIIEIKNTAVMPLADPRVSSKKYVLKMENGKATLSTAVSKNSDIKPVDKSLWQIKSVAVPDALLHEPQLQLNEENIKEIYMDIDNLELDMSDDESGEQSNSENKISVNVGRGKEAGWEDSSEICSNVSGLVKSSTEVAEKQKIPSENVTKTCTSYKISKLQQSNTNKNIQNRVNSVVKDLPKITCDLDCMDKETNKGEQIQDNHSMPVNMTETKPTRLSQMNEPDKHIPTGDVKAYKNKKDERNHITLSEMAMVQDDLELSDETSDNMEVTRQQVTEKEILHETQPSGAIKLHSLDSQRKSTCKTVSQEKSDNNEIINIKIEDRPKDLDGHKKVKNKRRKTKSKEKELSESLDDSVTDKKTKPKKDKESKPKQIKNKFTDLFGDSSSLITPEDLGIPASCVPLCEDAQDAVDININEILKAPTYIDTQEICNVSKKNPIQEQSTQSTNVLNLSTEDVEITKTSKEQMALPNIDTDIVYQNMKTELESSKPDVVKTVIISSGVQPQFVLDSQAATTEKRVADVEVNIQNIVDYNQLPAAKEYKKQNAMKALATSTPHKEFPIVNIKVNGGVKNLHDSNGENIGKTGQVLDQSNTNTQESHDAPDVRIFVRRRKKIIKKTT